MAESRARVWTFILWKESMDPDSENIINNFHVPFCMSPLHDKDFNEDGSPKKPHYHVILNFSGVKSFDQVKEITDACKGQFPVRVNDIFGLTRYLIHLDDPDKAPYNKSDIISHGGYDVDFYFEMPNSKKSVYIKEIALYINEHNIMEFDDINTYALYHKPEWFYILSECATNYFKVLINSRRHKLKKIQVDEDGVVCD